MGRAYLAACSHFRSRERDMDQWNGIGGKFPFLIESVMPNQSDIRQAITNQIISALESGNVLLWRCPEPGPHRQPPRP